MARHIEISGSVHATRVQLTPRDRDVLGLLCLGLARKNIAEELNIGERTTHGYINALIHSIRVDNSVQLVIWALQNPLALAGVACPPGLHARACACGGFYCELLRSHRQHQAQL